MEWSETQAAWKRVKAAWRGVLRAHAQLRRIKRAIKAQHLIQKAVALDADCLDMILNRTVDHTLEAVRRTGWPAYRLSHAEILRDIPPAGRA